MSDEDAQVVVSAGGGGRELAAGGVGEVGCLREVEVLFSEGGARWRWGLCGCGGGGHCGVVVSVGEVYVV